MAEQYLEFQENKACRNAKEFEQARFTSSWPLFAYLSNKSEKNAVVAGRERAKY